MNHSFENVTCAVLGIGISNTPLIKYLLANGAKVTARDKKKFEDLPAEIRALSDVKFVCGDDYLENITEEVIFRAPGIRFDKPQIAAAVANGSVLTSEMQLFFELCPAKIIGITGSDGKTTTTTLTYKALAAQYGEDKVFLGGNIGAPLLPKLPEMDENSFAVVELSSFQLHTMTRSPSVSVITNLSPNHLDYHTDMAEYIDAKKNIYRHQSPGSRLIVNASNEITAACVGDENEGCECRTFCGDFVYEKDGVIYKNGAAVLSTDDILLPGHHNVENYMAVIAALDGIVEDDVIRQLAKTFGGVEHRCELVREKDGVRYYNSSIDSSPTRTTAALSSFKEKVIIICGGYDKQIPFEPLAIPLCEHAKKVVLTGATAEKIKSALLSEAAGRSDIPEIVMEPCFDDAVRTASALATSGDTVILSPACASFDAFKNFEERGKRFKNIVNNL